MTEKISQNELLSLTTEIVASHVSNNTVAVVDLPGLIKAVYGSLAMQGAEEVKEAPEKPTPVVPIKKSVMPDYIVCLEDGKKLKMLKRHLKTRYNMSPEDYRKRWGLPDDYPMVAPAYAEQRSSLAKKIGLGTKPRARGRRASA
jgi:predicted transcriptional regulator